MTKFFLNNYHSSGQTILLNGNFSLISRNVSTKNASKFNELDLSNLTLPKINIQRNQARMANTVKALVLFLERMSGLRPTTITALGRLLHQLEMLYFRDPNTFVPLCKLLSNWYKVNMFRNIRQQDKIENKDWNEYIRWPNRLADIALEIETSSSPQELMMIHRMVLSVLDIYQVVVTPKLPNLSTIDKTSEINMDAINSIDIDRALERLNINVDLFTKTLQTAYQNAEWHSSSASGPNGQAVWMAHLDAHAINKDEEVKSNLFRFLKIVDRENVQSLFEMCVKLPSLFNFDKEDSLHSKLHMIFEKGDKTRVIAILDWWTQEALATFHKVLGETLKIIQMDGTFDQDKIAEKVRVMTADSQASLYSLDLTAATDRLPIKLQIRILEKLVKIEGFAQSWADLLVNRSFDIERKLKIRYAVGQPMGAKSSFVMLALTHHIIVQEAAALAGFANFSNYVILGDDIVIGDGKVAEAYKTIMKNLGLEIAPYKSIEATNLTSKFTLAEIAKRLFSSGYELTPIPVKLLANIMDQKDMAYQFQEVMFKRGLITDKTQFAVFMMGVLNSKQAMKELVRLNILPSFMTGMKSNFNMLGMQEFTLENWLKEKSISESTLNAFFQYTVLQEQMKRMSNIIQNSETTFDALTKAAKLANAQIIQSPSGTETIKVSDFTSAHMDKWGILSTMHPAKEVMLNEVNRISMTIMGLSVTHGYNLINMLLDNMIDSLKISVFEIVRDKELASSKVTRTLINKTIENIELAQRSPGQTLNYSVKFNPMNVVWFMKVTIGGSCTVSRTSQNVAATMMDASNRLKDFLGETNIKGIMSSSQRDRR